MILLAGSLHTFLIIIFMRLSLVEVCKIPDVQIHSKTAFLKSMISAQRAEALEMKDQIVSLSYTVKTIGVQGEEVGITSKRLPLKLKHKPQHPKPSSQPTSNFLPHRSFYSHALIPIKKEKSLAKIPTGPIQLLSARNTIQIQEGVPHQSNRFKIRAKSMSQFRRKPVGRKQREINIEQLGKVQGVAGIPSELRKKSFSGLLKECNMSQIKQEINPLMHQQNPLFKKIKRIKEVYPQLSQRKADSSDRPQTKFSSSSNLLRIYYEAN